MIEFDAVQLAGLGAACSLFLLLCLSALVLRMPGRAALRRLEALGQAQLADSERQAAVLAEAGRIQASRIESLQLATERRLGELTTSLAGEQGESRALLERGLREMASHMTDRLREIESRVETHLQDAVERQMQASFQRVIDQFTAVQKAMGEVQAVAAQVGDLRRVFANVKTRGGWGETQLRAVLDDVLPEGALVINARLAENSADVVEFAVRMPVRGEGTPLLPIDAKFPLADYERLLEAAEAADPEGERTARRGLEARLRLEARKIAGKYILPPRTTDFAVMYLPTDGLYAEAARIPGLIDELGQRLHVMVMGPSLLPALLRTVQLGYVTLALEQKAGQIADLLAATKREMLSMDDVLEKLARSAGSMAHTIEDARRRTRSVGRRLREVDSLRPDGGVPWFEPAEKAAE